MIRVISGSAGGLKLQTLDADSTKPTLDRVKEAAFSMLRDDIYGATVLDLFSGCGQMALEALSRGAESAVMVDSSRSAVNVIKENAAKTKLIKQCRVACADWKEFVKSASGKEKFSLVFLDPPYTDGLLDQIIEYIIKSDILTEDAIIIAESSKTGVPAPIDGISQKLYRYGKTYVSILRFGVGDE